MAKSVSGRKHTVRCTAQAPELTKSGTSVWFEVHAESEKIGTIVLGRGPSPGPEGRSKKELVLPGPNSAQLMNQHCYGD